MDLAVIWLTSQSLYLLIPAVYAGSCISPDGVLDIRSLHVKDSVLALPLQCEVMAALWENKQRYKASVYSCN